MQATSCGTAQANQLAIPQGNLWCVHYDTYTYDMDKAKAFLAQANTKPSAMDLLVTASTGKR